MDRVARWILSVSLGCWMLCADVVQAAPPPDIPIGTTPRGYLEVLRGSFLTPQISSSRYYTLLLRDDGSVWSCGSYPGPVQTGARLMHVLPPGTANWVSAGRRGSFAGVLAFGNVGLFGSFINYTYVPPVSGKPVAGYEVSYFVEDGQVMAVGNNDFGQLGNLSDSWSRTYSPVLTDTGRPLTDVKMVDAGSAFAVAVKWDGTVWTWGANHYGQLGDGTLNNRAYAAQVPGLPRIVAVSADTGRFLPPESQLHDHALALAADGTVWAWGENRDGECGNGTPGVPVDDPIQVSDPLTSPVQVLTGPGRALNGVVAIATGGAHSLALRRNGTVWAWGYNGTGQLGTGTYREGANSYAVPVPGLRSIRSIAAGPAMSFAVDWDGQAWAWGFGSNGNLCLSPETFGGRRFVDSPTQIVNTDGTPFNLNVRGPNPLVRPPILSGPTK